MIVIMNLPKRCRQCREHQRTIHEARTTHARTKRRYRSTAISPHQQCRRHTNHQPVLTPVAGLIFSNVLIWIESCWLGSENRDRGGIQWYSEPTSAPGPLLKININYEGCSGLSNVLKTASGPGAEHRKNRNASTRNDKRAQN